MGGLMGALGAQMGGMAGGLGGGLAGVMGGAIIGRLDDAAIEAIAAGAQEGTERGQTMGLEDYRRSIQDALLDTSKDEKNDWKKLLEFEDKQFKEQEKIAKGIDGILKKKFSIFGD